MNYIYFDFETYSEVDIKNAGAYAYAAHPTTEVICLSYKLPHEDKVRLWLPGDHIPQQLTDLGLEDYQYAAWNVQFDAEIWRHILCKKFNWPWPGYDKFTDVMVDAAYNGLPLSLDACSSALNASPKDKEGHALMLKLSKPAQITKNLRDPKRHHTQENLKRFYRYCIQDTKTLADIASRIKPAPRYEQVIRLMDHNMNARGIMCDLSFVEKALYMRERHRDHIRELIKKESGGLITSPTKRKETLAFLAAHKIITNSIAKDAVKEIRESTDNTRVLRVLDLYQQYNKTSLSKYARMQVQACPDHRLRGQQQMYGAHTGRWAGRGVQCQNLARGIFKTYMDYYNAREIVSMGDYDLLLMCYDSDKIMDVLSSLIRSAFIAEPGKEFHVSDFSSIEARVAFWLTDDKVGLDIYESLNGRLYEATAAAYYRVPIDKVTSKQRQFGKVVALACQYQVGERTILTQCKAYGIDATEGECKKAKEAYREKFSTLVEYWGELESAAVWALKNPKQMISCGPLKLAFYDKKLRIRLPSGRIMFYYDAAIKWKETPWGELKEMVTYMGIDQYTRRWARTSTYGGKLFENVVQAIARDLMAEAMVRAEDNDMHPVLTVHDEVVIEEILGRYTVEDLNRIMKTLPKWAKGMPVDAEGWTGPFYMKS